MSETVNQEATNNQDQVGDQTGTNEQTGTAEQAQEQKNEKLFTQEEVNGFINKRFGELMSQLNEFKEKAAKFDELEEAKKTELQRATEKAEKLQNELNSLKKAEEVRAIREKVAKEAGIPTASYSLLTGETEEACKEQAQTILSMLAPGTYPTLPDGGEARKVGNASAKDQFALWAQQTM